MGRRRLAPGRGLKRSRRDAKAPAVKVASPTLTAQESSVIERLALIAWGVGADQTKNLLANLDSLTEGEGAVKT